MTINLKDLFAVSEQMNDKVLMKLLNAIKDGQQKDFDYLKFKQSYKSLCQLGMDESTAAKSAFLTASTMGLTKVKLMLTVQHYKNILSKEKEQFAQALKNQIANNIDAKTMEVKRLQEKIEENTRKISQLQREQSIIEEEIQKLKETAEVSRLKIEDTRDQFKATFDILYTEVEEDGLLYDRIL
jgi:vacuolar-type H+-ATPase subunit I/STV1